MKYDAVIIGSGPNGLAAAVRLAGAGLSVKIFEAKKTPGGGMRTAELTLPGFYHDVCSAIHPLAASSPFLSTLPLKKYGLKWLSSPASLAHPFDDGTAFLLYNSVKETAAQFEEDEDNYSKLFTFLTEAWEKILPDILSPIKFPEHPVKFLKFGLKGMLSANLLSKMQFKKEKSKGYFSGLAAHSIVPLNSPFTAAVGLILGTLGHKGGWVFPEGGSQSITDSLVKYFISLGGEIETDVHIASMNQLPQSKIYLFDVTPKQLLKICGNRFSSLYKKRLSKFRYGAGVFKMDWALSEPVPWKSKKCNEAATLHLGGKYEEIALSEYSVWKNIHPEKPYVLIAQPGLFDKTRAPEGKHTLWGYCHVPPNSEVDMTNNIENQIERFAPGFKEIIIKRNTMNSLQMESYNNNYIGGDINGGVQDWRQLLTRPIVTLNPYSTSDKQIFICSSSTPPGGGVHGMCGFHAAEAALKKLGVQIK
jgi:phytoene dehydrogenase-like protein